MNNIPENEQWLLGGKCSLCRKRPYCKTKCKPNKEAIRELIRLERIKRIAIGGNEDAGH